MYEENSKDIHFLLDENSKIRDKLDSAYRLSKTESLNADEANSEKDEKDDIYSQFIGSNENLSVSLLIQFKTSHRISTN